MTHAQYVRNAWYMAGWDRDFGSGPAGCRILGEPIVIFRNEQNSAFALADMCPHRLAPLSLGRCEQGRLRCLYHGLLFETDGACAEVPGQVQPPQNLRVRSYPLIERYNAIWIWMGEPAAADATLIPDFVGYADPRWSMVPGKMDYAAPAKLINDNLLDLSHVGWVHRDRFAGGNPNAAKGWVYGQTKTEKLDRGVRVTRRLPNVPPTPSFGAAAMSKPGPGDVYSWYEFLVPGVFLQFVGRYPVGTLERAGEGAPLDEPLVSNFSCQAVTPIDDSHARYFFAFGPDSRFPEETQHFTHLAELAFLEDKRIIEGQYARMTEVPSARIRPLIMDQTVLIYEGLLKSLSAAETEARMMSDSIVKSD